MVMKSFTINKNLPDHIQINNIRIEYEAQITLLAVIIDDTFCKNVNG